jgi:palmitoyl-protein thioesterase
VQLTAAYRPIVIWHGMGDSCCDPKSLGHLMTTLKERMQGIYIKSIQTGETTDKDVKSGFLGNILDQVAQVCEDIKLDESLNDGFNAIGVSQVRIIEID